MGCTSGIHIGTNILDSTGDSSIIRQSVIRNLLAIRKAQERWQEVHDVGTLTNVFLVIAP